jgi:hypothetical protein
MRVIAIYLWYIDFFILIIFIFLIIYSSIHRFLTHICELTHDWCLLALKEDGEEGGGDLIGMVEDWRGDCLGILEAVLVRHVNMFYKGISYNIIYLRIAKKLYV